MRSDHYKQHRHPSWTIRQDPLLEPLQIRAEAADLMANVRDRGQVVRRRTDRVRSETDTGNRSRRAGQEIQRLPKDDANIRATGQEATAEEYGLIKFSYPRGRLPVRTWHSKDAFPTQPRFPLSHYVRPSAMLNNETPDLD